MNWDDARIFLSFSREGSFSGTAKRLEVQHSTISRRIQALEKQLNTTLIERCSHGYKLTLAGEELRDSALRMEQELLAFEANNSGQNQDISGELRVTAIANMASTILMPLLASFSNKYPQIQLKLEVTNDSVRLANREADIALRQTNNPGETLIGTRLATVASAVYGAKSYCQTINPEGDNVIWIGVDCCDFHRTWTKQANPQGHYNFSVDETSLTLGAIKQGLGVGFLPCFIGDEETSLQRYKEPEQAHDLGLWLLYHRDLRNTKRVQLFREHMQQHIPSLRPLLEGKNG